MKRIILSLDEDELKMIDELNPYQSRAEYIRQCIWYYVSDSDTHIKVGVGLAENNAILSKKKPGRPKVEKPTVPELKEKIRKIVGYHTA